jgi:hypothetical protein
VIVLVNGRMTMKKALVLATMILATAFVAGANGGGHGRASSRTRSYTSRSYTPRSKTRASTTHSEKRSEAEKDAFLRETGFPHGRPGYVVDHRVPLACGGADAPSNMQWQTVEAAKIKDKTERIGCK